MSGGWCDGGGSTLVLVELEFVDELDVLDSKWRKQRKRSSSDWSAAVAVAWAVVVVVVVEVPLVGWYEFEVVGAMEEFTIMCRNVLLPGP